MSFAQDKYTELRERTALVKARFSMMDAVEMCPVSGQDFFGENIDDFCPCCRESGMVIRGEFFRCGNCNAAGGPVTWVKMVRSVSTSVALDLIEKAPVYLNKRR